MTTKTGSVAPPERINIRYVPATGDQGTEVELPLKHLVIGDFKGHADDTALEDRQAIRIDGHNVDQVMSELGLCLRLDVPNALDDSREDDTLDIALSFRAMGDFRPESIANQVPELQRLLALREALVSLKGPMGNIPAFRHALQGLLSDEASRAALLREIEQATDTAQGATP